MPRVKKSTSACKAASRREPTTKTVPFTFEGGSYKVEISHNDSAAVIFNAFSAAIGGNKNIKITDSKGLKLQLGYIHIKANGSVQVQRANFVTQDMLNTSITKQKELEMLEQIMADWELKEYAEILPSDCAPKTKNMDSETASLFDDEVALVHPLEWSPKFIAKLCDISMRSKGCHVEAVKTIRDVVSTRFKDKSKKNWAVAQVTVADLSTVVDGLRANEENLDIAGRAMNVVETEVWKGGLDEAIERVEEDMDVEGREEDALNTHFELALR